MGALKLAASLKDVLWEAQLGGCWICKRRMQRQGGNDPDSASLDHIWPKAKYGGIGDIGVTLLACRACNGKRGSPQPTDDEIRALIAIWRRVNRRWLSFNIAVMDGEVRELEKRRARAELLRLLEAA